MVSESEKVFGNDGEFFHVQQEAPGFRDSGYYDGFVDSNLKSPFDIKPGMSLLSSVTEMTDKDKQDIWEKLKKEATECGHLITEEYKSANKDVAESVGNNCNTDEVNTETASDEKAVSDRPKTLENVTAIEETDANKPTLLQPPVSPTSVSDSEYQSGKESLESDSPIGSGTPDMETSVDTGEIFHSEDNADEPASNKGDKSDTDQAPDNCTVS